uniref:ANK_REP_REGION domain-containing protein n=1 Tax=Angiostrongylus cantonensis TaxID=6313 RepID=A0A0K0CXU9_ANGCA
LMETQEAPVSPVYAVYFPADIAKSPRNVFLTLQEAVKFANSPEGKSNGARFNRFGTPKEAMDFFASGEIRTPEETTTPVAPSEPIIPFPSVSRYQMNDLKKAIEKGTVEAVSDLIDSNPRFLINTSVMVCILLMEGFRFNALHIAARHGKASVVEKILQLIGDKRFLAAVYGTNEDDAQLRMENIVTSYLNTPDKVQFFLTLFYPTTFHIFCADPTSHESLPTFPCGVGFEDFHFISNVIECYEYLMVALSRKLTERDAKQRARWCSV